MLTRLLLGSSLLCVMLIALLIVASRIIALEMPSQGQIAYTATEGRQHILYLADVGRSIIYPLVANNHYKDGIGWSDDGKSLGYMQFEVLTGDHHIITMNMQTLESEVQLSRAYRAVLPDKFWSDDLSQIVYAIVNDNQTYFTHVDLEAEEIGVVYITSLLGWGYDVIWVGDDVHYAIRRSSLQKGIVSRLSNELALSKEWQLPYRLTYDPSFAPDGSRLILAAVGRGMTNYDLYLYDSELDEPINLSESRSLNEGIPIWSGDGEQILYKALNNVGQFLYIQSIDIAEPRQLYRNDGDRLQLMRFSPDDQQVSFVESIPGGRRATLCVIQLIGNTNLNCLAHHDTIDSLEWRPG